MGSTWGPQRDPLGPVSGGFPELDDELKDLAIQVMRAQLLLSLLRDLTYELHTRPGNIKAAAKLRSDKIAGVKEVEASEDGESD